MCDCAVKFNELLRPKNGRLVQGFNFSGESLSLLPTFVWVEKIESRKKAPPSVIASFCPFCGEKYQQGE